MDTYATIVISKDLCFLCLTFPAPPPLWSSPRLPLLLLSLFWVLENNWASISSLLCSLSWFRLSCSSSSSAKMAESHTSLAMRSRTSINIHPLSSPFLCPLPFLCKWCSIGSLHPRCSFSHSPSSFSSQSIISHSRTLPSTKTHVTVLAPTSKVTLSSIHGISAALSSACVNLGNSRSSNVK